MTTYTTLSDTTLQQDKPVTQSVARALRDNPLAIAENDGTAPSITGLDPASVVSASSSSFLAFTNLSASFDVHEFEIINVKPSTGASILRMQYSVDNGANWFGSNYNYDKVISGSTDEALTSQSAIALSQDNGLGDSAINGVVKIFRPGTTTHFKYATWDIYHGDNGGAYRRIMGGGYNSNPSLKSNAVNAVRFIFSSGTIASGTIVMRPRRAS